MIKNALRTLILSVLALSTLGVAGDAPYLDQVIESQRQEVAARPSDPAVHNDLGNLLLLAEKVEEAEGAYRQAKNLAPSDTASRFNLALLLQQEDRKREARDELDALLEIEPNFAWAHYQLGMLDASDKNRRKALAHYAKAFAIDPTLTFERNNPHIIDNELATEALLMSARFASSAVSRVPRSYGEGARIRDLMLQDLTEESEAEMMDEHSDDSGRSTGGGAVFGEESSSGVPVQEVESGDSFRSSEGGEGRSSRVIRNEDLAGIPAVGQASGSNRRGSSAGRNRSRSSTGRDTASATRAETPDRRSVRERLRAGSEGADRGRSVQRESGRSTNPAARSGSRGGGRRYIPSQGSTASLRLELLDEEPTGAGVTRGL